MIAYKLKRGMCDGWIGGLVTPKEAGEAVASEISGEEGLGHDERDTFTIEPYETTQAEIDALPEFSGW